MFDDYNYSQYNKYILHKEPNPKNIDFDDLDLSDFFTDNNSQNTLNEKYLKEHHSEKYDFNQFDLLSEEERNKKKLEIQ